MKRKKKNSYVRGLDILGLGAATMRAAARPAAPTPRAMSASSPLMRVTAAAPAPAASMRAATPALPSTASSAVSNRAMSLSPTTAAMQKAIADKNAASMPFAAAASPTPASALIANITAKTAAAAAAATPAPPPPVVPVPPPLLDAAAPALDLGTAGGGAGGFDDSASSPDDGTWDTGDDEEDTGESEAVARFRDSGGAWDPFDDGGGNSGESNDEDDGGSMADDASADEEDSNEDEVDNSEVTLMGYPMDDVDDIFLEQHEHEITDDPPDVERAHGSVHRGASYLNEMTYPPHGSSSGQQGGVMDPNDDDQIHVFGAQYARGIDVLGAATAALKKATAAKPPARAGFIPAKTKAGNSFIAHVVRSPQGGKPVDHQVSIKNARDAGKHAVSVGTALAAKAKNVGKAPAKAPPAKATAVHGAVAPKKAAPPQKGGKHHRLSAKAVGRVAAGAVKIGKGALTGADTHEKYIATSAKKLQAGVASVQQKTKPTVVTQIHGLTDFDIVAAEMDALADMYILGDATNPPDPNYPGYLMDGSPDPSYVDTSDVATDTLDPAMDPDQNYGLGQPPNQPPPLSAGVDYAPDSSLGGGFQSDNSVYDSSSVGGDITKLVNGAIVFDGSHPFNHMDVGSRVAYYGDTGAGAGEGVSPEDPNAKDYQAGGKYHGGFRWHNDGWWYNWNGDNQRGSEGNSVPALSKASMAHHWGPLIGNPQSEFKGLRFDVGSNKWFWPRDIAPAWATAADDQARLNQAILDYKAQLATSAANAAAQAAADQLDAQDAASVQEQQAKSALLIQNQSDLQDQQSVVDQAKLDAQQAAFDQQMQQQQQQLQMQAAQSQMQSDAQMQAAQASYAQAHPEEFFSPAAQAEALSPPGYDDGGGYASAAADLDQGSPVDDGGGDDMDSDEDSYDPDLDDVLGLRGSARIHHRRDQRR